MDKRMGLAMAMVLAGTAWAGEQTRAVEATPAAGTSAGVAPSQKATDSSTVVPSTSASKETSQTSSELTGRIVRTENSKIYVEHMGAIIPLKITSETKFQDANARRPKDLKEGQEVRAQFRVENKIDNLAVVIGAPQMGTGGSGSAGDEDDMEDTLNQGSSNEHEVIPDSSRSTLPSDPGSTTPLPEEPGTAPSPRY